MKYLLLLLTLMVFNAYAKLNDAQLNTLSEQFGVSRDLFFVVSIDSAPRPGFVYFLNITSQSFHNENDQNSWVATALAPEKVSGTVSIIATGDQILETLQNLKEQGKIVPGEAVRIWSADITGNPSNEVVGISKPEVRKDGSASYYKAVYFKFKIQNFEERKNWLK